MSGPIAVLGQGAWGNALTRAWSAGGAEVLAWHRTTDDQVLKGAGLVVSAVPAQATRPVLLRVAQHIAPDAIVVAAAKGLEQTTLARQSQIIATMVPDRSIAVLSGPGFAADLGQNLPTALTLATNGDGAERLQERLSTEALRLYLTDDVIGAELGGALKNVIAIACGVAMGAGLGESARAALMARGFSEMTRIALAAGASSETLGGLSGLGDLTLTCTSIQSRNYRYGVALGETGLAPMDGTFEGASTANAAAALAERHGVEAPVITATAALVAGDVSVQETIKALMRRPLRRE